MKKHIVYILSIGLVFACNEITKEEKKFDATMQEIITIHDEVMPKMGKISSLIRELEAKIDTTAIGQAHADAQEDLKDSYDFMMEWMADFSEKFPSGEEVTSKDPEILAKKMDVLEKEKTEVYIMRDQISSSIKNAQAILKKE